MKKLGDYIEEASKEGYTKKEIINLFLKKGYSKEEIESVLNPPKQNKKLEDFRGQDISYWDKTKLLFSQPKEFFEKVRDKNISKSIILLLIAFGIMFGLSILIGIFASIAFNNYSSYSLFSVMSFGTYLFIIPFAFGLTFVFSGIQHLFVKWFKGEGSYFDTYNVYAYSIVPAILFYIVPYVVFLGLIYSVILSTFGFSNYHRLSTGKAVTVALIPLILMFILIGLFILFLIMAFLRF